jgi:hypothetical protein
MKTKTFALFILAILLTISHAAAQGQPAQDESDSGAVVCEPGIYPVPPTDCLPLGPSIYLTELARLGITIPQQPLPAYNPSPHLVNIPYKYFHVDPVALPLYVSLVDAQAKVPASQSLPPGFVYISYTSRDETGHFFLSQSGFWIPGNGTRISDVPRFQGLLFRETPRNAFGWSSSFEQTPVRRAPGYGADAAGLVLDPYSVVHVFDTSVADGVTWSMIGPDQWLEGRKVAVVTPNPIPPEGVTNNRWIEVNLEEQTLSVYDNHQLIFATVAATGMEPFWTRPGLYQIYQKKETETMRNNDPSDFYFLENVPYTMYFDGPRALHAAYWRTAFGFTQSHGCVNLSVGDAHWLFDWAHEGDWVYIHDPSGQTPTDPELYQGGAY